MRYPVIVRTWTKGGMGVAICQTKREAERFVWQWVYAHGTVDGCLVRMENYQEYQDRVRDTWHQDEKLAKLEQWRQVEKAARMAAVDAPRSRQNAPGRAEG